MKLDVHQHLIPPTYRQVLTDAGVAAIGGRAVPDWTPELALAQMRDAGIDGAILSVSAPGTTVLADPGAASRLARTVNEYGAELSRTYPDRIGHFATLPMPDVIASAAEAEYALDNLHADGVVVLANTRGHYVGQPGQDRLFRVLNERAAIVLVHPAELPGPAVPDLPPFAADFLLDTTRAAYLPRQARSRPRLPTNSVHPQSRRRFRPLRSPPHGHRHGRRHRPQPPGHSHRLPQLLLRHRTLGQPRVTPGPAGVAQPDHVLYGSDWPFAPAAAVTYFDAGLTQHMTRSPLGRSIRAAVEHRNAQALFPRFASGQPLPTQAHAARISTAVKDRLARTVFSIMNPS